MENSPRAHQRCHAIPPRIPVTLWNKFGRADANSCERVSVWTTGFSVQDLLARHVPPGTMSGTTNGVWDFATIATSFAAVHARAVPTRPIVTTAHAYRARRAINTANHVGIVRRSIPWLPFLTNAARTS